MGLGWAALGIYYIYSLAQDHGDEATLGLGFIIAMVLFILPGLAVGGLGSIASKKKAKSNG